MPLTGFVLIDLVSKANIFLHYKRSGREHGLSLFNKAIKTKKKSHKVPINASIGSDSID